MHKYNSINPINPNNYRKFKYGDRVYINMGHCITNSGIIGTIVGFMNKNANEHTYDTNEYIILLDKVYRANSEFSNAYQFRATTASAGVLTLLPVKS